MVEGLRKRTARLTIEACQILLAMNSENLSFCPNDKEIAKSRGSANGPLPEMLVRHLHKMPHVPSCSFSRAVLKSGPLLEISHCP